MNNNIVLIDTYNSFIKEGMPPIRAAMHTGSLRLRPVLLTAGTTVLGLIPMVLAMNIDLLNRASLSGHPLPSGGTQLSSAIAGADFRHTANAAAHTLPLVLGANVSSRFNRWKGRKRIDR